MKMYYDKDVDVKALANKIVAVIGYGSQGMGQSQNMSDSGLKVIVGLREGGASWQKAKDDGMNVKTIEDAAKEADVIHILLPDEIQADVYEKSIAPYVKPGNTISFSHGYNIHFKYIKVPENVNITMIAPKGPGSMVRRTYLEGFGIPGLVAVEQDATGDALDVALAMGKACGLSKAGILETTFREETETDLFGEQAILCGGVTELINAGFTTLVEAGYQPEIAYFETCHELKLIVDLIYEKGFAGMWNDVSNTAEFGGLSRRDRIINDDAKKEMKKILSEIQKGKFTKEWALESTAKMPMLNRMRELESEEKIEKVGSKLRKACGLEKKAKEKEEKVVVVNFDKNKKK
ncbi:MAG: ketol-acid reductoisomerase [Methanobrevibacter arboriphilus]|uniref:Ketol-acid reductoisomerase (NADP(+)) n=1 Tax=Methanobrevibacter arboriphilus TaxID=39441 RepID=A0A843AIL8_METAZ|nr:ketol-acid reductoisomerase [Methanobrevibacter arboriphilus]MBF4469006.1 ketol-acid reductoisomerase [Methanobrevibacter arboriphilus]